ncbi:MAG: extracellular solute-binding protein [Nocardioidaceae bacterium]
MTPRLRHRVMAAAVTVAALSMAACAPGSQGGGGSETDAADVQTDVSSMGDLTLTVWDQEVRSGQDKPLQELNAAFEAKYPNVTIKRVSRSFSDLQKQVRLAISGDDAPDVVQANNARADMGAFVKAGLLRSLDGYADAYGWDERFSPGIRSVASYTEDGTTFGEGNLYGLPLTGELVGVWYNQAKLDRLGIQPPQTLEEFEAALQQAKQAGEVPIQFGNLDQWPGIHEWGFVQNEFVPREDIRSLGFGQPGASWTSEANAEAAQTLTEWVDSGYFTAGFNGLGYDPSWQSFVKGQGVFLISGTWLLADLEAGMGEDLGFMLPPVGETGELAVTGSTGLPFAITEASRHADPAAAYLDFITSEDAMARIADAGGLPVVDTDAQQVTGTQAELFDAWSTANTEDALVPYLDWATPDATDVVPTEAQELLGGEQSPQDFLGALQEDYGSFVQGNGG